MTIQINVGDHTSTESDFLPVPPAQRSVLKWARKRASIIAKTTPSANTYFRGLPGGRTLSQLLADRRIWINYCPTSIAFGETATNLREIGLGPGTFRIGRWTVLATLIHELAHCDGAPGGTDRRAEEAVLACGMGKRAERGGRDDPYTPYDPSIGG